MNINTKMYVNHIRSTWVKDSFRSVTVRFESRQHSLATIDPLVPAWTRLWRGIEWHRPELRESIVEHWLRGNNEVAVGICWNYICRINPNYKISDVPLRFTPLHMSHLTCIWHVYFWLKTRRRKIVCVSDLLVIIVQSGSGALAPVTGFLGKWSQWTWKLSWMSWISEWCNSRRCLAKRGKERPHWKRD